MRSDVENMSDHHHICFDYASDRASPQMTGATTTAFPAGLRHPGWISDPLAHMAATGVGLSERQFGFRSGRSTNNAQRLAAAAVNGRILVVVSLDIRITFNTIGWEILREALIRMGFLPPYLRRILDSYLSARSLHLCDDSMGNPVTTGVTRGVPQRLHAQASTLERRIRHRDPPTDASKRDRLGVFGRHAGRCRGGHGGGCAEPRERRVVVRHRSYSAIGAAFA